MKSTVKPTPLFILQTAKNRGISGVQTVLSSNLTALDRAVTLYYFGSPVLELFEHPNISLKSNTLKNFYKLVGQMLKKKYSVIVTQGPTPIDALFLLLGQLTKTPVIVHRHVIQTDLQWNYVKNFIYKLIDSITLKWAKRILYCTSNALQENQEAYSLTNGIVLTNGIEDLKLDPYKNVVRTVAMVAQLQSHKGWNLYLEAVHILSQKYPQIEFLGYGDGPMKGQLLPQFKTLNNFKWMGNQLPMKPHYKKIDVLVLPSNREGLSFACVEGLSYGCVLVITPVKGAKELLANNNGTLIPFEDSKALAKGIEQYILNADTFSCHSKKALELASTSFNLITVAKQLNHILNEVEN